MQPTRNLPAPCATLAGLRPTAGCQRTPRIYSRPCLATNLTSVGLEAADPGVVQIENRGFEHGVARCLCPKAGFRRLFMQTTGTIQRSPSPSMAHLTIRSGPKRRTPGRAKLTSWLEHFKRYRCMKYRNSCELVSINRNKFWPAPSAVDLIY